MSAPDPMTPPDCDLRGYEFMPLFGQRLFSSHWYSLALQNPRAGLAAEKLWWEAWQQCPAGSLPSDDLTLCRMADFGADLKAWGKAKAIALHGFVLCTDGRLYHELLCSLAIAAFEKRVKERLRKAAMRAKRHGAGQDADESGTGGGSPPEVPRDVPRDTTRTERGCPVGGDAAVRSERRGEERKKEKEGSEADASAADAPQNTQTVREAVWSEGVSIVAGLTGKSPQQCRSLLGKLLRDVDDDCPRLMRALRDAREAQPIDPVAWLTRAAAPPPRETPAERRIREREERMLRMTYPERYQDDTGKTIDHEPERSLLQ